MPLTSGARLGPYEILAPVGAGGMGEVYRARDTRLDRTVALKILAPHIAADPAARSRFEREGRATAALNHPHICTLHDIGTADGLDFLVMEYVEGQTLAARLASGALPRTETLALGAQIADALDRAHRHGIVHRDLKPGNIMVTRAGVKVLDFGLARVRAAVVAAAESTVAVQHTGEGVMLGTVPYMAPEQLQGRPADARADIWALGAVLHEMLTGTRAFDGPSPANIMAAILERDPPVLDAVTPGMPPLLGRIVGKCLAKDPNERWQSAGDVAAILRLVPDTATASTGMQPARSRRRERLAWTLAAGVLLALIVTAIPAIRHWREAPTERPEIRLDVVVPPTNDSSSLALSPDGRLIAFSGAPAGRRQQLWLRRLDSGILEPLGGTEGAIRPFWSPDSRSIAFFADGRLKRTDLAGSPPITLASVPETSDSGGAWSHDGSIIFSAARTLQRIPAAGGAFVVVAHQDDGEGMAGHLRPQFLPDGRRFLFYVPGSAASRGVYLGTIDEAVRRLPIHIDGPPVLVPPSHLVYVRQGTLFAQGFDFESLQTVGDPFPIARDVAAGAGPGAFSASATGTIVYRRAAEVRAGELAWFDRSGKRSGLVEGPQSVTGFNPELSPDGRRLAWQRTVDGNTDVWVMEISRGAPVRLTFDAANEGFPVWSPDGHRLVFMSQASGGLMNLRARLASGAGVDEPVLVTASHKMPTDWSPDGRYVIYRDLAPGSATGRDLFVVPVSGDRTPFPYLNTAAEEREAQFSPDGGWVAYQSNESGRFEVYVQPFPEPRGKWQVSFDGGTQPRWRKDGKELFYIALDGKLMAVPMSIETDTGTPQPGSPVVLFQTRIAGGALLGILKHQYAVSPDGQRFLMSVDSGETSSSSIAVLLNWRPLAPR